MKVIIEGQEYWTRSEYLPKSSDIALPLPDLWVQQQAGGKWMRVDTGVGAGAWLPNRLDIVANPAVQAQSERKRQEAEALKDWVSPLTRHELAKLDGQRLHFTGRFVRLGKKRAYKGFGTTGDRYDETVLLKDISDENGRIVADHLWFNYTQEFRFCDMKEDDVVNFEARVDGYAKGYEKDSYDYKLSRPTKVCLSGDPVG